MNTCNKCEVLKFKNVAYHLRILNTKYVYYLLIKKVT